MAPWASTPYRRSPTERQRTQRKCGRSEEGGIGPGGVVGVCHEGRGRRKRRTAWRLFGAAIVLGLVIGQLLSTLKDQQVFAAKKTDNKPEIAPKAPPSTDLEDYINPVQRLDSCSKPIGLNPERRSIDGPSNFDTNEYCYIRVTDQRHAWLWTARPHKGEGVACIMTNDLRYMESQMILHAAKKRILFNDLPRKKEEQQALIEKESKAGWGNTEMSDYLVLLVPYDYSPWDTSPKYFCVTVEFSLTFKKEGPAYPKEFVFSTGEIQGADLDPFKLDQGWTIVGKKEAYYISVTPKKWIDEGWQIWVNGKCGLMTMDEVYLDETTKMEVVVWQWKAQYLVPIYKPPPEEPPKAKSESLAYGAKSKTLKKRSSFGSFSDIAAWFSKGPTKLAPSPESVVDENDLQHLVSMCSSYYHLDASYA